MDEDAIIHHSIYGALSGPLESPEARGLRALAAVIWARAMGQPASAFKGLDEVAWLPWADAVREFMARPGVTASNVAGWIVLRDAEGDRMPINEAVFRLAAHRQAEAEGFPIRQPQRRW